MFGEENRSNIRTRFQMFCCSVVLVFILLLINFTSFYYYILFYLFIYFIRSLDILFRFSLSLSLTKFALKLPLDPKIRIQSTINDQKKTPFRSASLFLKKHRIFPVLFKSLFQLSAFLIHC